ncbi:hypothetical protein E1B28_000591 [Marasmius oreades]|uniref:WD40 repeat-like protein n=1 Tax=Marasmius oreades TaxID=181124 RepID=A0A9P7V1U8_9AGAR|nr:uncharacterized protein E1B28_000591 [Marasmius oreades]KAG7098677.1 hypothetical protein E1B28_000591 [Marasmius oreades]
MSSLPPPLGKLPGLYWDSEKKRYFTLPAQTVHASSPPSTSTQASSTPKKKKKRETVNKLDANITSGAKVERSSLPSQSIKKKQRSRRNSDDSDLQLESGSEVGVSISTAHSTRLNTRRNWKSLHDTVCFGSGLLGSGYSERERARSGLVKARLSNSQSPWKHTQAPLIIGNTITALDFSSTGRHQRRFVGDSLGWLYTYSRLWDRRSPREEEDADMERDWLYWTGEYQVNLHPGGEVSSIHTSETRCVATCFGPTTRICVQRFDRDDLPTTTLLTLPSHIYDVRSSCLVQGTETTSLGIILGAAKKAVYIPDLEYSSQREMRMLETDSDVFCVTTSAEFCDKVAFAGCRNGGIKRFDLRVSSAGVVKDKGQSSVVYMGAITRCPNEMVVGWMNGELNAYDLRFLRSTETTTPTRIFKGHVGGRNKHHHWESATTMTPYSDFLVSASEDGAVRMWSLRSSLSTEEAIELPKIRSEAGDGHVVRCVSMFEREEGGASGLPQLWASTSRGVDEVWKWEPGHLLN